MHELTLMRRVVEAVRTATGVARVHKVKLVVGQDAGVSPRALRFCFDVCVRGTALDGAVLEIVEPTGTELRLEEIEVG